MAASNISSARPPRHPELVSSPLAAMPSKISRSVAASAAPTARSNRSCAASQRARACIRLARPFFVRTTSLRLPSASLGSHASSRSRSRGRRFWPSVERSMTRASASSRMVAGSSARRSISDRMANCVAFSPAGAKAASYICDTRRDALRIAVQ